MAENKVIRVHKISQQHGSLVVVVPILITSALLLDSSSYVVFEWDRDTGKVELSKFETKGDSDAEDTGNTD